MPSGGPAFVPQVVAGIDETGAVRFRAVPDGTYRAEVLCDDHVLVDGPTTVEISATRVPALEWRVAPGLKLVVHVVDGTNRPLGGANVRATWPDRGLGLPPAAMMLTTDPNGRFETPSNLYPGTYLLEPYAYEGDPVSVELREGMGTVEATLRLKGDAFVEITVQTAEGAPIDAVRVTAVPNREGSGALRPEEDPAASAPAIPRIFSAIEAMPLGNGGFRIGPLTAGSYDIEVDDGVNAPIAHPVQVASGVERQNIVLDRDKIIHGSVLDANGQPQSDVWVSATCMTTGNVAPSEWISEHLAIKVLRESKRVASDAQGDFTLTEVSRAASTCTVRAEQPGGSIGVTENITPGQDIVISMAPAAASSDSQQSPHDRPAP
jgi:hypothetical protein